MKSQYELEIIGIDELTPYGNNARKHGTQDIEAIKNSIREFGFNDPIGVWGPENTIVEGHGRLQAAKELGLEEIPVIHLDHLTDEQRRAYALAHNRTAELSEWDMELMELELADIFDIDMDAFGFDEFGPEEMLDVQEDDFDPDINAEARTKAGDIWQLGEHRLLCGDSTDPAEIAEFLGGCEADLLLTDPPYNVDYTGKTKDALKIQNDNMDDQNFRAFLTDAMNAATPVMKPGAPFYIWHASSEGFNFHAACRAAGLQVRQTLVWVKNTMVLGRQDYHWKHEPCLYGWKDGAAHYFTPDRRQTTVVEDRQEFKKMKKAELVDLLEELFDDDTPTTVMHEDKPAVSDLHPTMKPIKLMARCIQNSSRKGDIVLDLFGGSGSTMIACEQLGRKCYMVERDPFYCDVIIERWEKFTGGTATLLQK